MAHSDPAGRSGESRSLLRRQALVLGRPWHSRCVLGSFSEPGCALKCHMKSYFLVWFAMRIMAATLRSTSSSVVAQQETEMRMAVYPCHTVPPHQQVPSA